MTTLIDEITAYDAMRSELETTHLGEWAIVKGGSLSGLFKDFQTAAREAVSRFGRGPYLIRQIGAPPATLPVSVVFGLSDDRSELRIPG
jgi:hypothetical protein